MALSLQQGRMHPEPQNRAVMMLRQLQLRLLRWPSASQLLLTN